MPASNRSRPFHFTFEAGARAGSCPDAKSAPKACLQQKVVPVNSYAAIELENEHFKGRVMVVHETGNEPELEDDAWTEEHDLQEQDGNRPRRGLELQLQGKFKTSCGLVGNRTGFWICAELSEALNMGWVMKNVATLGVKFAKTKADGNFHYNFGSASELPRFGFPVSQAFMTCATPPGEQPPTLGRINRSEINWLPSGPLAISSESTYTFVCRTPYLDLCTWELLNVPGLSPLPIERVIGNITTARLVFYDLGKAGSHSNCRQGSLLEFVVTRPRHGERWQALPRIGEEIPRTPLAEDSESEASDIDPDELVDANVHASDGSDDSDSDSELVEDEERLSRHETQVFSETGDWKPSPLAAAQIEDGGDVEVPFYIEAIHRRKPSKLVVWYVFGHFVPDTDSSWWHTMAVQQLVPHCGRRPQTTRSIRRRRAGVTATHRYGAQSLEQFRYAVCSNLAYELRSSTLRAALANSACGAVEAFSPSAKVVDSSASGKENWPSLLKVPYAGRVKLPTVPAPVQAPAQYLAREVKRRIARRPLLPPLFFDESGSRACELAFAHAKEGRSDILREGLVGALHFEGRICEELLRVSADGTVRCFSPYDCEKPRVRLPKEQILSVGRYERIFLGRFHVFELHTQLRVYAFCCADDRECSEWVKRFTVLLTGPGQPDVQLPLPGDMASQLLDTSNAQRWQAAKLLVLNDRRLLRPNLQPPETSCAAGLLDQILRLSEQPSSQEILSFADSTCILKAARLDSWCEEQRLAFWMNVYHCLLLHGRLLLGTPTSASEEAKFRSRVCYLVGLTPVSLQDIEDHILRVPKSGAMAVNAVTSRAKAGQAQAMHAVSSANSMATRLLMQIPMLFVSGSHRQHAEDSVQDPSRSDNHHPRWPFWTAPSLQVKCLPMNIGMHVPMPPLPWRRRALPCLFLGYVPNKGSAGEALLKQDLRMTLCLNRGNMASLSGVPILDEHNVHRQLDEISQAFVAAFVDVRREGDGFAKLLLPQRCRGIWRELQRSPDALIRFMWQFVPPDSGEAPQRLQVGFRKQDHTPRVRNEIGGFCYSASPAPRVFFPPLADVDFDLALIGTAQGSPVSATQSVELRSESSGSSFVQI